MPSADGILELSPSDLEKEIARLLDSSLGKRGAAVDHDGAPGKPDIVVDAGDFAFIVEVAKRSGASAASEHPAIREHREETERRLGKTTHLLFTCLATPGRLIREMAADNEQREAADDPARALFLDIEALDFLLGRLVSSSSDLYPLSRWHAWFRAWREVRDDTVALERATEIILAEDEEATTEVRRRANVRAQIEQEALRRDIQQLEDVLRHRNVVRDSAMHALVYIVFVKLYEEKREKPGVHSRFTTAGFERYRQSLPRRVRTDYKDRTLDYLLQEIALDEEVQAAGILEGVTLPPQIDDPLVTRSLLPVLDRYHFRGTHLDALGAVFEALARRAEKDTRIGQFFTPGPIVQMAVEMARPAPTELVLDPAVGTGRFLVASMERMLAHTAEVAGARPSEVAQAIRSTRLLGTDVDPWIVTIAKMNMYIHGDGKTNIRHQNGLFLADLAAFPEYPTLLGEVDLVLTNPPLGELNYRAYADEVTKKPSGRWDAATWLQERLPLLPGRFAEERIIENAEAKINEWEGRLALALRDGNHTEAEKARRWRRHHEEKRAAARVTLENGQAAYETSGVTAKGGALFLAAITHYLRPAADASKVEEWKGGRAAIIVDEAILNTPDYAETRRFLRRHFFIKAIVSFERDAFWYQARTTAKTSLLYIVKKPDPVSSNASRRSTATFETSDSRGPDSQVRPRYRTPWQPTVTSKQRWSTARSYSTKTAFALRWPSSSGPSQSTSGGSAATSRGSGSTTRTWQHERSRHHFRQITESSETTSNRWFATRKRPRRASTGLPRSNATLGKSDPRSSRAQSTLPPISG